MCKHKHTTVVSTLTDLGLVLIHQCDMCGVYVPSRDVDGEAIAADERAASTGYDKLMQKVVNDGPEEGRDGDDRRYGKYLASSFGVGGRVGGTVVR